MVQMVAARRAAASVREPCTARKLGTGYAACEYSLISPLRIFLRRTRFEARSTVAGPALLAAAAEPTAKFVTLAQAWL
jgi:hypothetical protein